jgi:hypothetical protein
MKELCSTHIQNDGDGWKDGGRGCDGLLHWEDHAAES